MFTITIGVTEVTTDFTMAVGDGTAAGDGTLVGAGIPGTGQVITDGASTRFLTMVTAITDGTTTTAETIGTTVVTITTADTIQIIMLTADEGMVTQRVAETTLVPEIMASDPILTLPGDVVTVQRGATIAMAAGLTRLLEIRHDHSLTQETTTTLLQEIPQV